MACDLTTLAADFRVRFPEFAAPVVTDEQLELYLGDACAIFSACPRATVYLAAHLVALDKANGMGGTGAPVDGGAGEHTAETVGAESVTMKSVSDKASDSLYATTAYGRRYIALRNACPAYGFTVRVL